MRFIPTTKDSIALTYVTVIALSLFITGLCDVLDFIIVKAVLLISFGILFIFTLIYALKNEAKKNRPKDQPQDDL